MVELIDEILNKFCSSCKEAAVDDTAFNIFKTDPNINAVLEHCSKTIGENYRDVIFENNPSLLYNFKSFWENDKYGGAKIENFGAVKCSPSTMQYVGVLSNLIDNFELIGSKIIEIGGGYGGQCKIVNDYFDIDEYHIVDLPEVGLLQNRYLNIFGNSGYSCKPVFDTFTPNDYPKKKYDLVISNYALSEVSPEQQIDYIKNICLNCDYGYLTCNQKLYGMELLEEKFDIKILPDIKGERDTNYIVIW